MSRCILPAYLLLTLFACFGAMPSYSQYYHALHGSSYAGAASIFNNPASPNNSLHQWDINIFSFQLANSTNTLYVKNSQLPTISNPAIRFTEGIQKRNINTSIDLNLLNAMYRINKKQSVAIGLRMRINNHIQTNAFNMNDSIGRLNQFLIANRNIPQLEGRFTSAGWLEGNFNYSQVLSENEQGRLSGGITLQVMKSMIGSFARVSRLTYLESIRTNDTIYSLTGGLGSFGYAANIDTWSTNINTQGNINNLIKNSKSAIGWSAGIEYMMYQQDEVATENMPKKYQWKLGLSLMDWGSNQYHTSKFTGQFFNNNLNVNDGDIANKLSHISNAGSLKDSLSLLLDTVTALAKTFSITNPTRMVLNADRNLGNNIYLNGQLSIPLSSSNSSNGMGTNDFNFISLTPRWETRNWGIFFPIQYNWYGQFWAGLAVKAGPLIAGIHHIGLLKKNTLLNGGGYLMLNIHPFGKKEIKSRLDCFE